LFEARDGDDRSKGYAHIDFKSKWDAVKVINEHQKSPMKIGDRKAVLDYSFPSRCKGDPVTRRAVKDRHGPSPTIFVGNIPYEATTEDIREALKSFGNVAAVMICTSICTHGKSKLHT